MIRIPSLVFLCAMMTAGVSLGQTTQPSDASPAAESNAQTSNSSNGDWPTLVTQMQQALADNNMELLHAMLADHVQIRQFHGHDPLEPSNFIAATAGATVLGGHAYIYPPLVMAADVAADFKSSSVVPEASKKKMVPTDDDDMKRANATAAQWIKQSVGAQKGDAIGVIVLWRATETPRNNEPVRGEPIFVLFRGAESENSFKIAQVIFGNPNVSADQ